MKIPLQTINSKLNEIEKEKNLLSIWGDFGVGKTTLSLQIALENVSELDQVYYIYSKPNLPIEKLENLIEGKEREFCENIIIIKLNNFEELFSLIQKLESNILNNLKNNRNPPKLLIFDSITELYRFTLNKEKKSHNVLLNFKLNFILATIYYLTTKFSLDFIIVNESSKEMQNEIYYEIQSGGKVMDYWISNSIHIQRTDLVNRRKIKFIKNKEILGDYVLSITDKGFKF